MELNDERDQKDALMKQPCFYIFLLRFCLWIAKSLHQRHCCMICVIEFFPPYSNNESRHAMTSYSMNSAFNFLNELH